MTILGYLVHFCMLLLWGIVLLGLGCGITRRRWRYASMKVSGGILLVMGIVGFLGTCMVATGTPWLVPSSCEWPVGWGHVVDTDDGLHIAASIPAGRVQVYDGQWRFLRGWSVNASGGDFEIASATGDRVEILTARGDKHFVYDLYGRIVSASTYPPDDYNKFKNVGQSMWVPTYPWLVIFSHPFLCWGAIPLGFVIAAIGAKRE